MTDSQDSLSVSVAGLGGDDNRFPPLLGGSTAHLGIVGSAQSMTSMREAARFQAAYGLWEEGSRQDSAVGSVDYFYETMQQEARQNETALPPFLLDGKIRAPRRRGRPAFPHLDQKVPTRERKFAFQTHSGKYRPSSYQKKIIFHAGS